MLVQAGPEVLPDVREALKSENAAVRERAILIVAWQDDTNSLTRLRVMSTANGPDADLAAWAIAKIESLHPAL
jgi:HEAT repeat protein